jgi:hypothetical protein
LNELVPDYLPAAPMDPWTQNTKPFGYIVIKGGLPDGSDRPLIYCLSDSHDGLFFRTDQPAYGYYSSYPSDDPTSPPKHGGQFRDIVRWQPQINPSGPTTQPLPQ